MTTTATMTASVNQDNKPAISLSTWIVDISNWNPSQIEFDSILDLFSGDTQKKIKSFHHRIDAKRSLIGNLMVQTIISSSYSIPWKEVKFSKNSYGKPYLLNKLPKGEGFQFNISHDGNLVACCFSQEKFRKKNDKEDDDQEHNPRDHDDIDFQSSSPSSSHELGVDIMEFKLPKHERSVTEFFSTLEDHLSLREKSLIAQRRKKEFVQQNLKESSSSFSPSTRTRTSLSSSGVVEEEDIELLESLLQIWTFKESIIKALGIGLSIELESMSLNTLITNNFENHSNVLKKEEEGKEGFREFKDFTLPSRPEQKLWIEDRIEPNWKFWSTFSNLKPIDDDHDSNLNEDTLRSKDRSINSSPQPYYHLSVAMRIHKPNILSPHQNIIHPIQFQSISDLFNLIIQSNPNLRYHLHSFL